MTISIPARSSGSRPVTQRRGQWIAAGLMLVIFIPIALALFVFYTGVGMPTGTINKGELLTKPVAFPDVSVTDAAGDAWQFTEQKNKWRWIITGGNDCDQHCEQQLYLTRQAHIRLGEKAGRVERIYLHPEQIDQNHYQYLQREHPHMQILSLPEKDFQQFTNAVTASQPDPESSARRFFLMDPEGWLMMSYQEKHSGNDVLDDIKRLLKLSYEG